MIIDMLMERFYKIDKGKIKVIKMKNINALVGKFEGEKIFEIVYSMEFNIITITFNNNINDEILKIVKEYSSENHEITILKKKEGIVVVIFKYLEVYGNR